VEQDYEALIRGLLRVGAFKLGAFRLRLHRDKPEAPLSPFYLDLRVIRSYPEVLISVAWALSEFTRGLTFDRLADVPTAATPIVTAMSIHTGVSMISPRLDAKEHGLARPIDGSFEEGQKVLMVDDLVTKADSKIEAASVLRDNGLIAEDVLVLLDREQGGREKLAQEGLTLHAAFTITQLLDHLERLEVATPLALDTCRRYLNNDLPGGWQEDMKAGWDEIAA
jgi:uridine monophosphate synthetase